ncbi:ATP-dependent nuclease [Bacillus thuringiensis]|uniref:ATP-dependent nuclease n=1 Tax=Bacillus thuringiensis TaxID=1428 RepID=UPI0011A2FB0E|nr:AAA family ATPase [Bacillus thuringiensis]
MKIKWVEIENFRSIKNSKRFYLNSELSILAGKNESGKSNVLKALKAFSDNRFEEDDKCNYCDNGEDPFVRVCFILENQEELEKIINNKNFLVEDTNEFIVTRGNGITYFSGDVTKILLNERQDYYKNKSVKFDSIIEDIQMLINVLNEHNEMNFLASKYNGIYPDYTEYRDYLEAVNSDIWDANGVLYEYDDETSIEDLKKLTEEFEVLVNEGEQRIDLLSNFIPNVILFNSFEDNLPEFITKEDINMPIVNNFFSLASCDSEKLFESFGKERSKLINGISTTITGDFQNYYNQDKIKIKTNADGERIYFEIYDDNDDINPFSIYQRSQGFQWFLSFFITLNAEKQKQSIILIDEPGLFLHAKAQEDVLTMLVNLAKQYQIVITTHSPYFMDPDRLDRISLVIKDKEIYTYVENKVHKNSDYTTLTPIITSIGLDITKNIGFSRDFNILTEGISDYYYLQAMKEYLRSEYVLLDFNIIPAQGVNSVSTLTSLLIGWDLKFIALFDNDNAGKRNYDKIKRDLHIDEEFLGFVSMQENMAIEDLFSPEDFKKYIFNELDVKKSNSDNVKKKEKALLAKLFNEKVMNSNGELTFSSFTIGNFTDLFKRLSLIIEDKRIVDSKEEILLNK